ncbi:MAG: hypothetical protein FWF50_02430 [Defluviitaleaceae bacterium]|nr:hypothetical protein [Defluviitaleaceae bacterium]
MTSKEFAKYNKFIIEILKDETKTELERIKFVLKILEDESNEDNPKS